MKPDQRFLSQPKQFWAYVRSISEKCGYTVRNENRIQVPSYAQLRKALTDLSLNPELVGDGTTPNALGETLLAYYEYRASVLNSKVENLLMDAESARALFEELRASLVPKCPLPMNKQTGDKKAHAFLTGIVNMIVEANAGGFPCNYDPRQLTTFTLGGAPVRTLARRVDGAFPSVINPLVLWEIKEYYYTTTFGSRVADGVYESLLDGMELEELRVSEGIDAKHVLVVDSHYTWWQCGKSYLCRMIDILHMGYVDEILFGREVVTELPRIIADAASQLSENARFDATNSGEAGTEMAESAVLDQSESVRFRTS